MGKGDIAHSEQFLLFPQCVLPFKRTSSHFHQIQNCRLQTLSVYKSKTCHLGKGLPTVLENISLILQCHARYQVQYPFLANFFPVIFPPLTSDACEKSSQWLWIESCVSTDLRQPKEAHTCVTDDHMT